MFDMLISLRVARYFIRKLEPVEAKLLLFLYVMVCSTYLTLLIKLSHLIPYALLQGTQASLGNFEDMTPSAYFSSPSCILKQISCKVSTELAFPILFFSG